MSKFDLVSPCCCEEFSEVFDGEDRSMCCGAKISEGGLCCDCKEHTDSYSAEYEYYCSKCDEGFDEPEKEWEWVERKGDNY